MSSDPLSSNLISTFLAVNETVALGNLELLLSIIGLLLLLISSALISGSEVALFGLSATDINQLKEHAKSCNVEVWFAPRLTQNELTVLLRNARASISLAHGEPFGLTPIEAFAVGTPAIYVKEGGFRDTIIDKENGRLIAREDIDIWHKALKEAKNIEKRIRWSEAGKEKIKSLDLSCEKHAERIYNIYQELNNRT